MHKYAQIYHICKICRICKICKICKICINIPNMQKYAKSYSIRTHAYICAICIGPGRPAKPGPGGVHILHVFAFIQVICTNNRECAYIKRVCPYIQRVCPYSAFFCISRRVTREEPLAATQCQQQKANLFPCNLPAAKLIL